MRTLCDVTRHHHDTVHASQSHATVGSRKQPGSSARVHDNRGGVRLALASRRARGQACRSQISGRLPSAAGQVRCCATLSGVAVPSSCSSERRADGLHSVAGARQWDCQRRATGSPVGHVGRVRCASTDAGRRVSRQSYVYDDFDPVVHEAVWGCTTMHQLGRIWLELIEAPLTDAQPPEELMKAGVDPAIVADAVARYPLPGWERRMQSGRQVHPATLVVVLRKLGMMMHDVRHVQPTATFQASLLFRLRLALYRTSDSFTLDELSSIAWTVSRLPRQSLLGHSSDFTSIVLLLARKLRGHAERGDLDCVQLSMCASAFAR